jgi:Rhamnan synthesis protein F
MSSEQGDSLPKWSQRIRNSARRLAGKEKRFGEGMSQAEQDLGMRASGARILPDWQPATLYSELAYPSLSVRERKVAVSAHLYYPEYISPLLKGLERFPVSSDVFVSTPSSEIAQEVEQAARNHPGVVDVRVTPNRGRNFGPLLVEFGQRLKGYDLVSHVHSKRTPQGVSELVNDWILRQWEFGLLDSRLIERTIGAFENDKSIGLAYANVSELLPPYAFTWLQNEPIAREWFEAHDEQMPEGQFPFPAGGMFWARPTVIDRFLNLGSTYDLFPEELGQVDATYQHFLERLLGVEATKNGSHHLIYCPNLDKFTTDTSYVWSAYQYQTLDGFFRRILEAKTVSFSLFGTLQRFSVDSRAYVAYVAALDGLKKGAQLDQARLDTYRRLLNELMRTDQSSIEGPNRNSGSQLSEEEQVILDRTLLAESHPRVEAIELLTKTARAGIPIMIIEHDEMNVKILRLILESMGLPSDIEIITPSSISSSVEDFWQALVERKIIAPESHLHIGSSRRYDEQLPGTNHVPALGILGANDRWRMKTDGLIDDFSPTGKSISQWIERGIQISDFGSTPFD